MDTLENNIENTLETYTIMAPSNKEDTYAKFTIEDAASPFIFNDILDKSICKIHRLLR